MDAVVRKPVPVPTADTAPFWEGVRRRELLLQQCAGCGRYQFYPRSLCQHCWHRELRWVPAAGSGAVHSYTVVHRPPSSAFQAPYVVAVVELSEGVRMMGNVVDSQPSDVHIGMQVNVVFVVHEDGLIPAFRPI